MSLASYVAIGLKSFFGNSDIEDDEIVELGELDGKSYDALKETYQRSILRGKNLEDGWNNSVDFHASDRILTAPNIPVIGPIVAKVKKLIIDSRLKKGLKASEEAQLSALEQDSTVKDATKTNPYTNPRGKDVVRTKPAGELKDTPRESGGKVRFRDR